MGTVKNTPIEFTAGELYEIAYALDGRIVYLEKAMLSSSGDKELIGDWLNFARSALEKINGRVAL